MWTKNVSTCVKAYTWWIFSNQPSNSLRINWKLFRSPFLSLARHFFIYMNCSISKLAGTRSCLESIPMKSCVGYLYEFFQQITKRKFQHHFQLQAQYTLQDSFLLCVLRFNSAFGVKFSRYALAYSVPILAVTWCPFHSSFRCVNDQSVLKARLDWS